MAAPPSEVRAPAPTRGPAHPAVYLDCAASTPVDDDVTAVMLDVQRTLGANPSSVHKAGLRAAREVERARIRIAERIGCAPECILFTSCATEANNQVLKGVFGPGGRPGAHLVLSSVEHPSVHEVATFLEQTGQARVTRIPVDSAGRVGLADLAAALQPDTALVSIMHANNEVGTLQPVAAIGALCRERGVLFHTDACQSFLKVPIDLKALPIDFLTLNAHKVHGPKGVGALYARAGVTLAPLLHGGGHERNLRSGTLNVAGIAGFGEAVARYPDTENARIAGLRTYLLHALHTAFPDLRENSPSTDCIGNIVNVSFPGRSGKWLFQELDRRNIQVSASSACHSTKLTPSHVLLAMGQDPQTADEALRISLGRFNTPSDITALCDALVALLTPSTTGATP